MALLVSIPVHLAGLSSYQQPLYWGVKSSSGSEHKKSVLAYWYLYGRERPGGWVP